MINSYWSRLSKIYWFVSCEQINYFNRFLSAQGSHLPFSLENGLENVVPVTHEQNIICSKTHLDGTTHEQTIICGQLHVGHFVDFRPMERLKENASNDWRRSIRTVTKGPGKREHIVADTNVSRFARARNICCRHIFCVRDTKIVSDFIQKHFVSATNVSQFAQPKKHHG